MVELKMGWRTVDLPYSVRIPNVTEEMFDELVDEDSKAELLDGVMILHSPVAPRHDDVAGFIRSLMRFYAAARRKGKVFGPDALIHLASCRKFAPDWFFLKTQHVPRRLPRKQFESPFDLIGEVLSPSNRDHDLEDKRPAYREAGVQEIWLIDLDNQEVLVDRRFKRGYRTTRVHSGRVLSQVLDGFWIEAEWLWGEALPNDMDCLQEILK